MHFQVFIHPQRIHRSRIKACQKHIHDNQQIKFLVFHTKRYIFIVVLKLIARRIVIRMEHLVIVPDSLLQKIPRGLIECRSILGILLVKNTVRLLLIRSIAEYCRNTQLFRWVCRHLLFEFLIVQFRHWNAGNRKDRVETAEALLVLDLRHLVPLSRCNFRNIGQSTIAIVIP